MTNYIDPLTIEKAKDTSEGGLEDALDNAAAGDTIVMAASEVITTPMEFSVDDVTIVFSPNVRLVVTSGTEGVIVSGNRIDLVGLQVEGAHGGSMTSLIKITGSNNSIERTRLHATNGVTVDDAVILDGDNNYIIASALPILSTITNTVTNNGTDNDYRIRG